MTVWFVLWIIQKLETFKIINYFLMPVMWNGTQFIIILPALGVIFSVCILEHITDEKWCTTM